MANNSQQPLPGSDRSPQDLKADGSSVRTNSDGSKHVTIWSREGSRYSYDVDAKGQFVKGSAHFTDEAAKKLAEGGNTRW